MFINFVFNITQLYSLMLLKIYLIIISLIIVYFIKVFKNPNLNYNNYNIQN